MLKKRHDFIKSIFMFEKLKYLPHKSPGFLCTQPKLKKVELAIEQLHMHFHRLWFLIAKITIKYYFISVVGGFVGHLLSLLGYFGYLGRELTFKN